MDLIEAVDFVSRDTFQGLKPNGEGWAAISLGNPAEMPPSNLARFSNFLRLEFLDLTPECLAKYDAPEEALCQPAQVAAVLSLVERLHAAPELYKLVVHCRMGLSRSPAFALMVHAVTGCSFPRREDSGFANRHVLKMAMAQIGRPIGVPGYREQPEFGPSLMI